MAVCFAKRVELLKPSEIREILKITQQQDMISFAGGLPAPELFPVTELRRISEEILQGKARTALQYSTTEGYEPLRIQISQRMNNKFQTNVNERNILITSGSQQALDLSGKLFLDEGDIVLCESPTYLAAISAFKAYQPRFIEVPTDDEGMVTSELENILRVNGRVKLIYVIPDFQNPTGRTWSIGRRQEFIRIVNKYQVPVIEDNPYGELRFEDEIPPALYSMDNSGLIIFTGTFSKIFCPGLRIGWIAADPKIISKYVLLKQGVDLCTSLRSQMEIARYIETCDLEAHIRQLIQVYSKRRDAMVEALQECFPPGITFTRPQGGLFLWVEMPEHIKSKDLLSKCLDRGVAFVPGDAFFPNSGRQNSFRLNYSNMPEEKIQEGIRRLAEVLQSY